MIIFKAEEMNWSEHSIADWQSTKWEINRDGTYTYIRDNGICVFETTKNIKQYTERTGKMNSEDFQKLIAFLENEFEEASKWNRSACDGTGWNMTLFDETGNLSCKFTGYIYGSEPLKRLVELLP